MVRVVGTLLIAASVVFATACGKDRDTGSVFSSHNDQACPSGIEGTWKTTDANVGKSQVKFERDSEGLIVSNSFSLHLRIDGQYHENEGTLLTGSCRDGEVRTVVQNASVHQITQYRVENGVLKVTVSSRAGQAAQAEITQLSLQKI